MEDNSTSKNKKLYTFILFIISAILFSISYIVGFQLYSIIKYDNISWLLSSVAILFSLTAILFSASRSAIGEYERHEFYEKAKQSFFSAILIVIALSILFIYNKLNLNPNVFNNESGYSVGKLLISGFLFLIYSFLIFAGILHAFTVIFSIAKTLKNFNRTTKLTYEEAIFTRNSKRIKYKIIWFNLTHVINFKYLFHIHTLNESISVEYLKANKSLKVYQIMLGSNENIPERFKLILSNYLLEGGINLSESKSPKELFIWFTNTDFEFCLFDIPNAISNSLKIYNSELNNK